MLSADSFYERLKCDSRAMVICTEQKRKPVYRNARVLRLTRPILYNRVLDCGYFKVSIIVKKFNYLIPLLFFIGFVTGCSDPFKAPIEKRLHSEDGAMAADISANGQLSVVSSIERGLTVWDLNLDQPKFEWRHQGDGNNLVTNIHISADSSFVVTSDREAFALWSVTSGEPIGFWRIDESSIRDIAVSNNGNGILVARSNGKVMFFEPDTGRRLEFLGHQEKINSIDISPNGQFALTGSNDYVAYLWNTSNGQIIRTFTHTNRVTRVALDDQGRYAFTADTTNQANIWDVQTGELISQLDIFVRQQIFTDAVFSDNGEWLLTGSPSRRVNLWSVQSGKELSEWRVEPNEHAPLRTAVVNAVAFIDESTIVSESSSGLAEFWKIENE